MARAMNYFIFCTIFLASSAISHADPTPATVPLPSASQVYPTIHMEPGAELTEQGRNIRGVYLPYSKVVAWKSRKIARWVKTVGATAVIMDVKDDHGRITFSRSMTNAKGYPHGAAFRMKKHVEALHEAGIYTIARLVCFKDNQLIRVLPKTAVRDRRTGKVWRDKGNLAWLDPHSEVAREHIVAVAQAAEKLGFDEIQLDYVRFPVERAAKFARYPNKVGNPDRHNVIAALLARIDAAVKIPLSIDVFGLTAYHRKDSKVLGQTLEHLAPYIDAISPMVYLANWPRRYWENPKPSQTHALVNNAVKSIRRRLGKNIAVRPLLQAFKWRADNYGTAFILNQINAAESGGSSGYIFWNQGGHYRKLSLVWQRIDAR